MHSFGLSFSSPDPISDQVSVGLGVGLVFEAVLVALQSSVWKSERRYRRENLSLSAQFVTSMSIVLNV